MPQDNELQFSVDVASAISRGARSYQEDAMVADVSNGAELGFVVLADGMGGHAAGDVASQIVVTEVFRALTFMRSEMAADHECIRETLTSAAEAANNRLRAHVEMHPKCDGMGSTLVVAVVVAESLYWLSVGDSPLFLFRDNTLTQLNEDHSMNRAIETMVQAGALSEEEGRDHPDRNVLTSVLYGKPIPEVDCPEEPFHLQGGDTLIVASDGLQFLSNTQIEEVLRDRPLSGSAERADALMQAVASLEDPDLDNVSMTILQLKSLRNMAEVTALRPMPRGETAHTSVLQRVFGGTPQSRGAAL